MGNTDKTPEQSTVAKTEPTKSSWDSVKDAANSVVDLTGTALHAAAYSAFQQPATGIAQIVDHYAPQKNLEKSVQFMDAPKEEKFGSAGWHAEQIGSAVGQLVPFLLARAAAKPVLGKVFGSAEAESASLVARKAPIGMTLAESTSAGFITGTLFTPGDASAQNGFWTNRIENGGKSAAAMATLTATSGALGRLSTAEGMSPTLAKLLRNPISSGIISGAPAGFVSAELDSLQRDKKLASLQEVAQGAYSMSMIGGAFGAVSAAGMRFAPRSNDRTTDATTAEPPANNRALRAPAADETTSPSDTAKQDQAAKQNQTPIQLELPFDLIEQRKPVETEANASTPPVVAERPAAPAETPAAEPEQTSLVLGKELSPTAQKALEVLNAVKLENPKEKETMSGPEDMPITLQEAQSMLVLMNESSKDGSALYQLISDRGKIASWMAKEIWYEASPENVEKKLPGIYEHALLAADPSNTKDDFVGLTYNERSVGISSTEEAQKFLSTWRRSQPLSVWLNWSGTPDTIGLKKLIDWEHVDSIPDHAIKPIADRYGLTGEALTADTSLQKLLDAAPGWAFLPQMPTELATEIARMDIRQQLASLAAIEKTAKHFDVNLSESHKLFEGDKAEEARAVLLDNIDEISKLRPRLALNQTSADVVPLAVEEMHSNTLDQEHRTALSRGLIMFRRPLQILAGMDGATFRDAYDALKRDNPERDPSKHYLDWHERSAVILATIFKSNWQNWLNTQSKLGRDGFDATKWLRASPPSEVKGLGAFLIENNKRNVKHLERIADVWKDIKDVDTKKFNDVLDAALLKRYDEIKDPVFAREAGKWFVTRKEYANLEPRYLASLDTPSPFPLDAKWEERGLTGRFLPRNDPRGLFVGEYTNCCQHPGGNADSSAWYGQENPKSGFFIVENANKEIIAQSWAIVTDDGGLIFDNVEAKGLGKQHDAVLTIYKDAANSLLPKFHNVTMGIGNSDLDWTTLPRARGTLIQRLPSDFSGYSDAGQQVFLASMGRLPADVDGKTEVRGALSLDKHAMLKVKQDNSPEAWNHIQWSKTTRGFVVQDPQGKIQGYALYEPQNRVVSDLAIRPGSRANYGQMLTTELIKTLRQSGGQWTTDMRESPSYRAVLKAGELGRINIVSDEVTGSPLGMEPMHRVVLEFPTKQAKSADGSPE